MEDNGPMTRIPFVASDSQGHPLQAPAGIGRPKILLIDDDQNLCQLLRTRFASEGLDLNTVFLGKEGL